ncbi:MAG: hypothetical protein O7H41_16325 [Planctomycetota bacterium]|nr:hypothetical protein [Planctomycetota bacterium]
MKPFRPLFVSYASMDEFPMIGVYKRCLRLMRPLMALGVEATLLHFGERLPLDALVRTVLKRADVRQIGLGAPPTAFFDVLREVQPSIVVLGETPVRGYLATLHRAAASMGIRQICIENYYGHSHSRVHMDRWPDISGWLFLGLPDTGSWGWMGRRVCLAPPLLARRAALDSKPAADLTILAYDAHVARFGYDLLRRLSPPLVPTIVTTKPLQGLFGGQRTRIRQAVLPLPSETAYRQLLSRSRLVVCKNGFQQMAESLSVGTPVICPSVYGGVPPELVPPHMAPYIRISDPTAPDWRRIISTVRSLPFHRVDMPWLKEFAEIRQPIDVALRGLLRLFAT